MKLASFLAMKGFTMSMVGRVSINGTPVDIISKGEVKIGDVVKINGREVRVTSDGPCYVNSLGERDGQPR